MKKNTWLLWHLTQGQRSRYVRGTALMILGTILFYLAPLITRSAIDNLLVPSHPDTSPGLVLRLINFLTGPQAALGWKLATAGGMILALMLGHGLLTFLRTKLTAVASETIAQNLRLRLYDHLQHVPCAYHDNAQTGDLVQRCTSDVDTIRQFFSAQLVEVLRALVLIIIVVPMLLWLDWKQALIALALVPLMVGFAILFFTRVRTSFKAMDEAEGAMTSVLQENLTGIRVVRAFARHDFEQQLFEEKNARHRALNLRMFQLMARYWSMADFLAFMQMALVLLTGAARVAQGSMTIGDLVAFQTYVGMYIWPLRQMGRVVADLGKASISATRVQEILNHPRELNPSSATPAAPITPALPERVTGRIDFHEVCFQHGSTPVLHNITLSILPGETLAILGPSGSGKSSLIQLLLRFYDYSSGSLQIDGLELNNLDRKYVRRQIGAVLQEPFLYSKTLRDNICLGQPTATEDEMVAAAQAACIHESIESFSEKYDTLIGERGVTLSGGQRQRVAIARALLISAPILILDDALSAVDLRTETQIRQALLQRRGRQTTLLIAHRLSTLMYADRIIVLEAGRITQSGTHAQLIANPGLYRRLWHIQSDLEDNLRQELGEPVTTTSAATPTDTDGATLGVKP